nr:immunoglobulin heavy chain junction region [Macaca mulatta]MOX64392.1 immunoglobulin heavy chain junction region [Macaca mulatta]MOX65316.1 immunoglobulin heavy chain junction region [Macaca mulatta]MOX66254.1 immunoglobulin heavy chain junction region [Macaca mulatta]
CVKSGSASLHWYLEIW